MKTFIGFILEKLRINKETKIEKKKEYSDAEIDDLLDKYTRNDVPQGIKNDIFYKTPQAEWTNYQKMEAYMKKGSKPERLVNSIKNKEKLMKRWVAGMDLEWEEAAEVFKNEIIKRGYYTEEELFVYILIYKVKANREKYRKFLW